MSVKEVYLVGNPPWGFRMNGGADAGHQLRISRVNPGSKAEAKGVREGDLITSINGQSTKCLTNSESHALLRTVKESLLLGLNEEKNSSPRRRSREIKSASIISQEKDRSESPAQTKGSSKPSESQKRHQRRTRLKHRIKDFLGFKTKGKKEPEDEGWVIVDATSLKGQESHSVSELDTDEENRFIAAQGKEEIFINEEIYDNFDFKKSRESSQTPTSYTSTPLVNRKDQNQSEDSEFLNKKVESIIIKEVTNDNKFDSNESLPDYRNINYSPSSPVKNQQTHEKRITFSVAEKDKVFPKPNELWLLRNDDSTEQSATETHICEDEDLSESLKVFPPSEMVEVCNATIMIEDDREGSGTVNVPLVVAEDDRIDPTRPGRISNPDYEPIEVNSSGVVFPPFSSTLNYYFPQRRFLEAITEENSDLSESNEDKQEKKDKPWENSELIKQVNNIGAIPDDWFGSDEGIDTSWRDGKSIEEVSDVAIVSDSFSDSDLISEDLKMSRGVSEDGTIKYNLSKGKSKEQCFKQQNSKGNIVLGKPPIQTVNSNRIDTKLHIQQGEVGSLNKSNEEKLIKLDLINKDKIQKTNEKKTVPTVGSKVTCRIIKQDEITSTTNQGLNSSTDENKASNDKKIFVTRECDKKVSRQGLENESNTTNVSKLSCKVVEQKDIQVSSQNIVEKSSSAICKTSSNTKPAPQDSVQTKLPTQSKKYIKTTPSSSVLKNVVFSYYNGSKEPLKAEISKNHETTDKKEKTENIPRISVNTSIELSTDIIKHGSEKDIEHIYIDSSDSDAFSNNSNISNSNRTSYTFEKEELGILDEKDGEIICPENLVDTTKHIIREEITNINQSVKEISDICRSTSTEKLNIAPNHTKQIKYNFKPCMLPNILSPVLNRKSNTPVKQNLNKRRFSHPMSENDFHKISNGVSCFNCSTSLVSNTSNRKEKLFCNNSNRVITPVIPIKDPKMKESPVAVRKLSLKSLPSTPSPNIFSFPSNKYENQSFESIALEFSDGSVSSESYTLPDVAQDNELSDVSSDTIKYFHIPATPKIVPHSPVLTSEIVDLHKKFVERRGYHEVSPVLKRKTEKHIEKNPEPDLIALSKCKDQNEKSYTPELLVEAANLLALHKYHESRQRKMKLDKKDKSTNDKINTETSESLKAENKSKGSDREVKKLTDPPTEIGMNEKIIEYKQVNKSECTENETVGKSRLLELFQKLDSKSSTTECTLPESEPFPYWLILGEDLDLKDIKEFEQKSGISISDFTEDNSSSNDVPESTEPEEDLCQESSSSDSELSVLESGPNSLGNESLIVVKSLPPGEIFQRKMYEEYLGKMAELAERRNMKIIKVSTSSNASNLPSESQPLESEFMNKLKKRNEKLGIVIDEEESNEKATNVMANNKDDLPRHLKELMEITEECGDIVGKDGLLVEIDEALSPERKGFLTAKGVWSPAQTPEAERKKFDFSNEIKEEREREKQREEEVNKEPQPPVWTPRSAGASPTLERKFRSVNFQSPTPSRRHEIKTSNETPELPKELPIEEKDSKLRLISSSSENSTLSSSLRLPAAQNPTITLLQKAREGHIPRGAQYLEEQPIVGPNEIIYSVKKEHVSEDHSKKIIDLGPRKIEGIGPTTKEGIPIVLRSEVKEDNQQRWYKRMYDSLHKAEFDNDFVTVKYKARRGQNPYSSYSGGYSSEPDRLGYDSDASLSKYATLDRRKIRNKENDFTTSTMPRNRYAPGVNYAVNVYKNQPGRIENYEPGNSSISDKETKKWWDEVMDIFDGDLNDPRGNHLSTKSGGKPFTYALKDAGYESDSTLVFRRRENNMSGQLLSPTEQKMAYKVIQKGGEVPFQGLRKAAPERPKEDSEIEYFPLSPTLTRIRVHKRSPKEKVYYPVTGDLTYRPVKRTSRSVVPSPPRRDSSRYNPTLKMFAHAGPSSPERKTDYYRDRLVTRLPRSDSVDLKIEKSQGRIKTSGVKYEQPKTQYGVIRQRKEVLRKSPELKAPAEVKKALKESKVPSGTTVKSSTTLYTSIRNKKPKEDKALKVTVAISTKGKEILSPSSTSSKSDVRKSPILSKSITRAKPDSPPVSRCLRPSSRSSVASTTISEQQKKINKKEIVIDTKKKKEKKPEIITKVIDKYKEDDKKKNKKKQENGKKKNGSKKKDKENIPLDTPNKSDEIIALPEPPKQQDFFQKLLLRESNSPCPSITSTTVSRTPSVLERAKKFCEPQNTGFKSEPSLRNLNVYLCQKRPVTESRFRSLERKPSRALSPFYGTYEFYDKLDKFDQPNNVWDYSLTYGPAYDCVKSRSSSEPPHTSPTLSQDVCDNVESVSPSTSRSPSCRRIRRPTSRAIETISGVRRKFRSKSLNEADRQSHMGSTSSLSISQLTDHEEYRTYFFELLHQTKKSDKFKELHKFYSSLERMGELEKTTSNTDLRPRLRGEEVIDFDRWKQLRNKEKAEKELNILYEKLKDDQKEKGFLFQPKQPIRWSGDRGLRHKEKSVEDLRLQYQKLVQRAQSEKKMDIDTSSDVYTPLWRGNSVANLANSLTSITGSKRGRPVIENSQSLIKPPVKKDKEIGSRLWSSLSMEQVNALKNQLTEIYSTVSNLKHERIKRMKQNIEDYEVNVTDLRGESPLHVRSNSLVAPNQLYSPAVKKKSLKRQECMKADSISTLPSWKSTSLSENDKKQLSMSLSAEVKERIKKKKHGTLVIPRETLGAVAAIKGSKKFKSPCNSETSPRTCYSLLSDESIDKGDDRNKDFLLVLTPKEKASDVKKMVDDWGSKEYARMVQTTSSSSSSASTVIHLGYKDDIKASSSRIGDLSQSHTDLRHEPETYRAERKTLYSSQSFTNLKDLFGERNASTYATLPLRNIRKPCYSSTDSLYKSISPDPMKYYRAYLNVVKVGDVRKLKEKFESYDDIYNLRKEQSPVRKMFQSDPDLTRDFLSRKGGEFKKVVVKGQEVGDVQWLRRKYEPRKVSPVPFKVEDRYMPHINVISKTASLQRRAHTPPSRMDVSRTGKVDQLKDRFEKQGMSLLGQMYTSTPEITELRDIAPYLECEWVAHQNPSRSPSRRKIRPRPASSSPIRQSILKQKDIFANQDFNPEIHRPLYRYQPEPWQSRSWARPTVTFKEPLGNPIPTPPRDNTSRQRIQESPSRYVESEVNIHYKSPVRREAKAIWPEDELAQRQAEIMRRIYQEQKRTKYLNELHDMYSRRHADNLLPSQKSPIPLNRYDDFPVEVQPPRPRDRTPEPKLVARALYNFVGQTSRELSFRRGDIIYVRRQIDKNWYEGEHNAMIGLFPFNYVEIIPYDGIRTLPKKASEGQARARFNFQAQTHLELSLVKGELVLLTRKVDENWFEGRIGNRKGIFPVSYVEVLVEPGERPETPTSGSTPSKPLVAPASHSVMLNGAKDMGQQHYQPPRPTIYSSSSLPPTSKIHDISLVNQTLHIDTQSDPVPYRVMYNYRPQNEDELELKEGDIVYVMEKCDDGWYVGSLHRNGQFGTFPGNYVERIQ